MDKRCGTCKNKRINKAYFKDKNGSLSYAVWCYTHSKNKHKDDICSKWEGDSCEDL